MTVKTITISAAMMIMTAFCCFGLTPNSNVEFCDEASDTTFFTNILKQEIAANPAGTAQNYVARMAEVFDGTPYIKGSLEGDGPEKLRVCRKGVDCTTFVEMSMALAMTAAENRSSWRDFIYNLERLRYRNGHIDGYSSRLHYVTDWALNNSTRGIMTEVTARIANADYSVKSLDWITSHRADYPALKDDAEFEAMKHVEGGYHGHRTPYIKAGNLEGAALRDGDIVAFATKLPGLDVSHVGIIRMKGGKPYLMHASSKAGKVVTETRPLSEYLRRNRELTGVRIFRLN